MSDKTTKQAAEKVAQKPKQAPSPKTLGQANTSKAKHKRVKPKRSRLRKRIALGFLLVTLAGVGGGSYYAWNKYSPMAYAYVTNGYEIADQLDDQSLSSQRTTVIRDANGKVIKELNSIQNLNITIDQANVLLKDGFVAVEDERFYEHHGVDGWATLRAIKTMLSNGATQGGSTITQQLVKNKILQNFEQTANRKVTEMVIAQEVEKKFTKDQILESYLNNIYFGHGAYGVNSAAKAYFNKDQKDLTVRESAVIIGLTNNPTLYDPITNMDSSNNKVEEVLDKMLRNKVISKDQYEEAVKQETVINQGELFNQKEYTDNYAVSFAISRAAEELAKLDGFEMVYKFGTDEEYQQYQTLRGQVMQQQIEKILGGGYDIQTTINMDTQAQLEQTVQNLMSPWTDVNPETGKLDLQASVTVIDNVTHNVVAVVGGRGTESDYVNRAWNGYRQPGSTAKPIIAYAPAFDAGTVVPNGMLYDGVVPEYPSVGNADGTYRNQNMTVRRAVDMSLNTPAIRASQGTDMNVVTDNLAKMQFGRLHPYDVNNIIAIGGLTYGTTTTEMAGAYSAFTNQGNYVEPTNVESIKNSATGEILYQNPRTKVKVYSQEASYAMLDILKTAATGYTTYYTQAVADNYPKNLQAGKSGTTDYFKDSYWVGITSYYTSAVWVGRDSNVSLGDEEQTLAKTINRHINNLLLAGKEPRDFVKPDSVIKNGDSIEFTSKEDLNKEATSLTSTVFDTEQGKAKEESRKSNQNRLNEESYRIVYGLSLAEEETLESEAKAKIDSVNVSEFTNKSQYQDFLYKLTEARTAVDKVRRPSKRTEFKKLLEELQTSVSEKYSELIYQENLEKYYEKQTKISDAVSKSDKERQKLIDEQKNHLKKQKLEVEKNPSQANIDKLDEIVYNLNRLGEPQPYFEIQTRDGKFISMTEQGAVASSSSSMN